MPSAGEAVGVKVKVPVTLGVTVKVLDAALPEVNVTEVVVKVPLSPPKVMVIVVVEPTVPFGVNVKLVEAVFKTPPEGPVNVYELAAKVTEVGTVPEYFKFPPESMKFIGEITADPDGLELITYVKTEV